MSQVSTQLRITKAKIKIADYTGDYVTDMASAEEIGLLKEGVDFSGELVVKTAELYAYNADVFVCSYFKSAKVTGTIADVNRANIDRLVTMFNTTTATGTHTMVLDSSKSTAYTEKVIIIEEQDYSANNEKTTLIFYPCHFTGKMDFSYKKDTEVVMAFQFDIYADPETQNGDIGMVMKVVDKA